MTFKDNWEFQEKYIDVIRNILKDNAMYIVDVEVSTPEEDMKEATDLKIKITAGDVAVRIRRGICGFRDFTVRGYCDGNRTEIDKLQDGYGDWYLYAWENNTRNGIDEWVLINLNKARPLFYDKRKVKMNTDGRTGFLTYSINELVEYGCIVSYKLQDINR